MDSPGTARPTVRRARTTDVRAIKELVDRYAARNILLAKDLVTLYEDVPDFWVAVSPDGTLLGCGALHVLWEDLGEIRTVAVRQEARGQGVGHAIVDALVSAARELDLRRIFVLTFEAAFFAQHGFTKIEGAPVPREVYQLMRRSYDPGVAEFLDLPYVKPNTLGNTRMLLNLDQGTSEQGPPDQSSSSSSSGAEPETGPPPRSM